MSKWVKMAMSIDKTDEEIKNLMEKIQYAMMRTGKMTKDMDKAMDVLLGTKATEQGDMVPLELANEDLYEEISK